ncbi:hypothetical protein GCM10010340_48620 [Streptomyces griseoloalbus]|nr:hypothetical protein GCM10010340_48620 [Streptomyces albaduncus]
MPYPEFQSCTSKRYVSKKPRHATPARYSGACFEPELRAAADRGEVVLVDPQRLYTGS